MADEIDTAAATQAAYTRLRALKVVEEEGWARVTALQLAEGRHVLALSDTHFRTLLTSEVFGWCVGIGDGHGGHGGLVEAVDQEPVPELLTLAEAAERMPSVHWWGPKRDEKMTTEGVNYSVQNGDLFAVYGLRRLRHVFNAQVAYVTAQRHVKMLAYDHQPTAAAELGEAKAREAWLRIRRLLPDAPRPQQLAVDVTPLPSPARLPVTGGVEPKRHRRALLLAQQLGWLEFLEPTDRGYLIQIAGVEKELPAAMTLPYVLGVGDAHRVTMHGGGAVRGLGSKVAYREGLG